MRSTLLKSSFPYKSFFLGLSEHVRMSWACFWFSRKEKEERKNCRTHSWGGKRHPCMRQPFYHSRQFILVEYNLYPLLSWREALHRERFCGCLPTRETSNTLMIEISFPKFEKFAISLKINPYSVLLTLFCISWGIDCNKNTYNDSDTLNLCHNLNFYFFSLSWFWKLKIFILGTIL